MRRVCAGLLVLHAALFAAPQVSAYRAEVRRGDGRNYSVEINITTTGSAWAKPGHTLEGYDGERLFDFRVQSSLGGSTTHHLEKLGTLDRLTLDSAVSPYTVRYTVDAGESRAARIPLVVPEIPTTGAPGSVTIAVYPGDGDVISGDTFPALHRDASGAFVAELANVPNHVQIEMLPLSDVGFRERWLTPSTVSDFFVIALIACGSIARALIRRKREA